MSGSVSIPERFSSVLAEKVGLTLSEISDYQIHCVLVFEGRLDEGRLRRAFELSLDAEPVLGSRLIMSFWSPYWLRDDGVSYQEAFEVVDADEGGKVADYITSLFDPISGPQVRLRILRSGSDMLCVKFNHLLADAAGVREYVYLLFDIYRRLEKEPQYVPVPNIHGTRGLRQVSRQLGLRDRLGALALSVREFGIKCAGMDWGPAPEPEGGFKDHVIFRRIDSYDLRSLRDFASDNNATLNDLFMTAIYRALHKIGGKAEGRPLSLMSTADLRRYLPGKRADSICTLSGFVNSTIGTEPGDSCIETLGKVKREFDSLKAGYIGLSDWPALAAIFKALPFALAARLVRFLTWHVQFRRGKVYACLSNMGSFDMGRLDPGGAVVKDAYMTAPLTHEPNIFLMGLSGFGDSIVVSAGLRASETEAALLEDVLDDFIYELPC